MLYWLLFISLSLDLHVISKYKTCLVPQVQIRFVSRVDAKRQCVVWLGTFEGDRDFFKDPVTLRIGDSDCSVSLLSDTEARGCLTDVGLLNFCNVKNLATIRLA